jgi:hypothetical protein
MTATVPVDIVSLRALHAATTPGEWVDHWDDVCDNPESEQRVISSSQAGLGGIVVGLTPWNNGPNVVICKEDAAFVVAAHNVFPELLAMAEAADRVQSEWRTWAAAEMDRQRAEAAAMARRLEIAENALYKISLDGSKWSEAKADLALVAEVKASRTSKVDNMNNDIDPLKEFLALAERWEKVSSGMTFEWKANDGSTSFRMGSPRKSSAKKR